MKTGSKKDFGAGYNILPIWKKRLDAKTLVTTPHSNVLYAMSYVDLGKDGPLVFAAPPMLQGILLEVWQRTIPVDGGKFAGDVGLPGPDGGKGGKFLLLPPTMATKRKCLKDTTSTDPGPTTSSSSFVPFTRIRRI